MKRRGTVTLTVIPDVTKFNRAMQNLGRAIQQIGEAAARVGASLLGFARQLVKVDPRVTHGPRNFANDGTWQSDLCAAWLHDSCPLATDCDCTCHGGSVR